MPRALLTLFLFLSAFTLAACDRASDIAAPEADQQSARRTIEMLRARQFDEIARSIDPSLDAANVRVQLDEMAAQFPEEEPKSTKLIIARVTNGTDPAGAQAQRVDMTFAYDFPSAQVLASIALKRTASATTIVSFNAARIPENFSNFTLTGRSLTQYTALVLALAVPLFVLWTLVSCIRTPMERTRKWLWCLFIIVGVGKFSIDWVTGVWTFTPIYLLLFGAGAVRGLGGYGPWIVSVAIPVGAIAFQVWRARQTPRPGIAPLPIEE